MQAQGKEIKELIIAIGVDADTLNPQEETTTLIQNMCDLIYDNFFYQDPQGKLHPRLATKADVSADGLTYTLHLRKGVNSPTAPISTPTPSSSPSTAPSTPSCGCRCALPSAW